MNEIEEARQTNTDLEMIAEQIVINRMILEAVVTEWRTGKPCAKLI